MTEHVIFVQTRRQISDIQDDRPVCGGKTQTTNVFIGGCTYRSKTQRLKERWDDAFPLDDLHQAEELVARYEIDRTVMPDRRCIVLCRT